jgi:hypothetical protein
MRAFVQVFYIPDDPTGTLRISTRKSGMSERIKFSAILLNLNDEELIIPDVQFDAVRHINAEKLHEIVHNMVQAAELKYIGIHHEKNKLIIKGASEYISGSTSIKQREACATGAKEEDDDDGGAHSSSSLSDDIIKNYHVRYINIAIKPHQVCEDLRLYIKKDYPLIIEYPLTGLGVLRYCILTHSDTDNNSHYHGTTRANAPPPPLLEDEPVHEPNTKAWSDNDEDKWSDEFDLNDEEGGDMY